MAKRNYLGRQVDSDTYDRKVECIESSLVLYNELISLQCETF